jgi:hypothetical protein
VKDETNWICMMYGGIHAISCDHVFVALLAAAAAGWAVLLRTGALRSVRALIIRPGAPHPGAAPSFLVPF